MVLLSLLLAATVSGAQQEPPRLRPPAVPLVAHDPYFSIWSPADKLTDAATVHWTGRPHRLTSMLRIDGACVRVLGDEPRTVPALRQVDLEVLPTRTIARFADARVALTLTFTTPALPDDLDVLARPLTYVTWEVRALDGQAHDVAVYLDASAEIAVDDPAQEVLEQKRTAGGLVVRACGSRAQPVLVRKGDDLRIDWGHLLVAMAGTDGEVTSAWVGASTAHDRFVAGDRTLGDDLDARPRAVSEEWPVLALARRLDAVRDDPRTCRAVIAYDDGWSIRSFGQPLRPLWKRRDADLLVAGERDWPAVRARCAAFDQELMADLEAVGGRRYAEIAALAYRQCLAGNKLCADAAGAPLMFPKENFSNGCIATVDVIYPMAPLFLLLAPDLAKAMLVPPLDYALSARWRFPFAPHDLGTYPHAEGQVYGDGERGERNQMPVEECGNLLLLVAAVAKVEGTPAFAARSWYALRQWAEYLAEHGRDPENQLCTDDFTGHLAHNVNLSLKAILALAAYARLCEQRGLRDEAEHFRGVAERFAADWQARADDGDHTRLAFDKPGTWSQKYNLVWDRLLGLGLFPPEVAQREMAFYRRMQQPFGLPLDHRASFTKSDWTLWTATLTGERADFEALVRPIWRYLHETPQRVPFCDWHRTDSGAKINMIARPVVGGVFLPLLGDAARWQKWSARGDHRAKRWAPLRVEVMAECLPTARASKAAWRCTEQAPAQDWMQPDFTDADWREGEAGFGSAGTPGAVIGTPWTSSDLWARRRFRLSAADARQGLFLRVHHDEDAEVYVDGALAAQLSGYTTDYVTVPMAPAARALLTHEGVEHVLAVHCHQTAGGQFVDVGLATPLPPTVVPAPSSEDRAEAAGWRPGSVWFDQHADIVAWAERHRPKVVLLGDSIVQGFVGGRDVRGAGAAAFTRDLAPLGAGNFGIAGDRTQHVLWRLDHGALAGLRPELVVLAIGTNNLTAGDSVDDTVAGIEAIVQRLRQLGVPRILLAGVLPRGATAADPMRRAAAAVNARLAATAHPDDVRVLDFGATFLDPSGAARAELFGGDFLHLSAAGYDAWARALAASIGQ